MKRKRSWQLALGIVSALAIMVVLTACSGLNSQQKSASSEQPPVQKSEKPTTVYYDFGDILVPKALSIDSGKSFVMSTSGLTAGVLSLKGRVEVHSLLEFFEKRMPMDGWALENKFRALRSMLLFTKQNRNCVITIDEGRFNTLVEIWVAPSVQGTMSGLHK